MYLLYFLLGALKNAEYSSLVKKRIDLALRKAHLQLKVNLINWPTFLSLSNSERIFMSIFIRKELKEKKKNWGQLERAPANLNYSNINTG